jgi:hypothetical protein
VAASPDLEDGHYWAYAEQDGDGGTGVSAATSFTVDTTPPHTSISSGPQGSTAATSASFAFSPSEAGSTFECRLDGGAGRRAPRRSPTPGSRTTCTPSTSAPRRRGQRGPDARVPHLGRGHLRGDVTLEVPADDALTGDSTPIFSGHAEHGGGRLRHGERRGVPAGGRRGGRAVQTRSASRSARDGSWSVSASPALADGTYVAYATQDDSNSETAYSAPRRFTVDTTEPASR